MVLRRRPFSDPIITSIIVPLSGGEPDVSRFDATRGNLGVMVGTVLTEVGPRTGVEDHTVPIGHLAQAADFDADHIVVLGRSMETGSLYLSTLPKRRL